MQLFLLKIFAENILTNGNLSLFIFLYIYIFFQFHDVIMQKPLLEPYEIVIATNKTNMMDCHANSCSGI